MIRFQVGGLGGVVSEGEIWWSTRKKENRFFLVSVRNLDIQGRWQEVFVDTEAPQ